jgi:hypothetical protein
MYVSPLGMPVIIWPIIPALDDRWLWVLSSQRNENWQGKPNYLEVTCPSASLPSTNSIWLDQSSNPAHCSGKSATNHLSYGTT